MYNVIIARGEYIGRSIKRYIFPSIWIQRSIKLITVRYEETKERPSENRIKWWTFDCEGRILKHMIFLEDRCKSTLFRCISDFMLPLTIFIYMHLCYANSTNKTLNRQNSMKVVKLSISFLQRRTNIDCEVAPIQRTPGLKCPLWNDDHTRTSSC